MRHQRTAESGADAPLHGGEGSIRTSAPGSAARRDEPSRAGRALRLLVLGALLALFWALLRWAPVSAQQEASIASLTPVLALARLCVNEAGIAAYRRDDCAAIHEVITWRREHLPAYRGLSYVDAARRYSHDKITRTDRRRGWIARLTPGLDTRPHGHPRHLLWLDRPRRGERPQRTGARTHWRRTYQLALDVYRDEIGMRCELQPHDWGSERLDAASYERDNPTAIRLDCGRTCSRVDCNIFWHLPAYERRWGTAW